MVAGVGDGLEGTRKTGEEPGAIHQGEPGLSRREKFITPLFFLSQ